MEQGLAQESVLAIVQDSDGFMWFGTQAGLSRFDGYRVTVYRNEVSDPPSLANNWVRVLHVDRARAHVGRHRRRPRPLRPGHAELHPLPAATSRPGAATATATCAPSPTTARTACGSATSDGLQHFDIEHRQIHASGTTTPAIRTAWPTTRSTRWRSTPAGACGSAPPRAWTAWRRARAASSTTASPAATCSYNAVQALLVDASQTLWIGSLAGLERCAALRPAPAGAAPPRRGRRHHARLGHRAVPGRRRPTSGSAAYDDGLYRWQPQARRFANYRQPPSDSHSLADNQVSALFRDRVGTFWVGTWYAGVSRVDLGSGGFARIVRQPDAPDSLSDNKVRAHRSTTATAGCGSAPTAA